MQRTIATTQPFSFDHTLTFIRRFLPVSTDYVLGDRSLTAAIAIDGRAVPFTLFDRDGELVIDTERRSIDRVARVAADFVGARDDLAPFYDAAEGDPVMAFLLGFASAVDLPAGCPLAKPSIVGSLHGLHHVRFLTLAEIAVYCVMMQRAPIAMAATLKRRFLERFGLEVRVGDTTLRAFPELDGLVALDPEDISEAIGNRRRGEQIANVVRGVAAIGETILCEAPYTEARDALLRIPGIGPFSAAAILLRGLGRMDDVPRAVFAGDGPALYGASFDECEIRRRYGRHIGYWSFYLKTGAARMRDALPNKPRGAMRRSAA